MLFLWRKKETPFDSSKLEGWYAINIWGRLIDPAFENLDINLVRGEGMSLTSSDRKNLERTINERKKIGRKGDGVFRLSKDRLEFGAIEAKRKWEGEYCMPPTISISKTIVTPRSSELENRLYVSSAECTN
ncbi:hypothetical protein Glove_26g247 [Diversispora epigaea]|uniref:Uncharacterized protein n=1 Tax=Diversispora epigaea TaxID=1348612 RepID=A0A397JUJ7_9GLOM|nr:hypothetical protein Glove_26g247 [Diversispora epigaea]